MSKRKGNLLIFATFLLSTTATILTIVSLATENWIISDLRDATNPEKSYVNYGLFKGSLEINPNLATSRTEKIYMTCIFSENICAFSNEGTEVARQQEINEILNDPSCKIRNKIAEIDLVKKTINSVNYIFNKTINLKCDPMFMNSIFYVTTVLFLISAILMGFVIFYINVRNINGNQINPWLNMWELYKFNALAAAGTFLTMVMWGAQFDQFISKNVGITETLRGQLESNSSLGLSYWLLLLPLFLHLANIGLLYYRQLLLIEEPAIPISIVARELQRLNYRT